MNLTSEKIKETLTQLTELFHLEKNIFQKFVIIHKYVDFLNKTPITKEALQTIFDDSAATMGDIYENLPNKEARNKIRGKKFWMYYSDLEMIHDIMGEFKVGKTSERTEFDNLCQDFSEPYSEEILELAFKVVNCHVFNRLDQESFLNEKKKDGKTWFDEKNSILYIKGERVMINNHDKITNAHKILNYIFTTNKDNLEDDFFYSEIAFEEFEDMEYKEDKCAWRKYFTACQEIKNKIIKCTKNKVDNFLLFNSGQKGRVKINFEYL
ncbi:MAG: hypothetical protein HY931_02450 [Candidatus Falkowbacteria bacterium]|nr:MAG: hypothetical protein HY931_02450 [Candidatus Falkowbacteria bacterium]